MECGILIFCRIDGLKGDVLGNKCFTKRGLRGKINGLHN